MTKFRHLIWNHGRRGRLLLSASQATPKSPMSATSRLIAPDDVGTGPAIQAHGGAVPHLRAAGPIIISTKDRHLYLVQGGGLRAALWHRVGREGFQWQGLLTSPAGGMPDWTRPGDLIARQALLAALHGWRAGQSDGRRRCIRQHGLPHPRHQPGRTIGTRSPLRLLPAGQRRRPPTSMSGSASAPR